MRFRSLDLLAYGPFTGKSVDLSGGSQGVHLVFGPNEAGKSVALQAIRELLFGIHAQTPYNFLHEYSKLRLRAVIELSDGKSLDFIRKKGKGTRNTLIDPSAPEGALLPDTALRPFLDNTDQETFERIYCIGHEDLIAGGRMMKELKGLAGESLYAAGLGHVDPGDVLKRLEREARELYWPRTKSKIKVAHDRYKALVKERKSATAYSSRWEGLQKTISEKERELEALAQELKEQERRRSRLERYRRALPLVAKRAVLIERLGELEGVTLLPESYSSQKRQESQLELSHARRRAEEATAALEGESGLRATVAAIEIPEALLAEDETIQRLHELLGGHLKAGRDLPRRLEEAKTLKERARQRLDSLALKVPLEQVETLRLTKQQKLDIQKLGNRERELNQKVDAQEQRRVDAELELEEREQVLGAMDEPLDVTTLHRLVARAQKEGDLEEQRRRLCVELEESERELERALDSLAGWQGTVDELLCQPWPNVETIRRFDAELAALRTELENNESAAERIRASLAEAKREADALLKVGEIPSESDVREIRERRDQRWAEVRESWLTGTPPPSEELAESYQSDVSAADELADRLRREIERATKLAEVRARQEHGRRELERLFVEGDEVGVRRESVLEAWRACWSELEPSRVLTPAEMREWLREKEAIGSTAKVVGSKKLALEQLDERIEAHRRSLSQELAALALEPAGDSEGLTVLLERCLAKCGQVDAAAQRRQQLEEDLRRLSKEAKRAVKARELAAGRLARWERDWEEAVSTLRAPERLNAESANARIATFDELFADIDRLAGIEHRIEKMLEDAERFAAEVRAVVERVAPDLAREDEATAVKKLYGRLSEARSDRVKLEERRVKLEEKEQVLQSAEEAIAEAEERLALLRKLAGVERDDHLPEAEERSNELRHLRSQLAELDERLLELSGGASLENFILEVEPYDVDSLVAEHPEIEAEIQRLEAVRTTLIETLSELRREGDAINGSSVAAAADEAALGLAASIRVDVEQYVRLRLASTILRQQVEEHRARTQDPILARAGDLFSQMTCGAHAGLRIDFDEEQPVIKGLRASTDELVAVEAMSDGARDQLFLSLRLAYLERALESGEPLPFIVDDILVNFDDHRAAATFQVLAELSKKTQVIFFTHHEHLIERARAALSSGQLFVQRLERGL